MRTPIIILAIFSTVVILATGFWAKLSSLVLPNTTWGLYTKSFFENILAGAHGTIIDLFLVGIVLYWFERRTEQRDKEAKANSDRSAAITRHKETLADLRLYEGSDCPHRTLTTIKRLLALDSQDFPCFEANLQGMYIENLKLTDKNMIAVNFRNATLSNTTLTDCKCDAANFIKAEFKHVTLENVNLNRSKFCGATLSGTDFSTCKIERADFSDAILRSAIFKGVDCKGVNFKDADLRSVNFKGAKNLTRKMLLTAKNTDHIQIDVLS
ncbi:pentapeptide repeat-containing protein [Pseudomonas fildesensis]|uniref:Pentapeptide repeat-containing protein n=1 Tax=Pseudomonas fildesensis TaxID=1674920 RepID=A0A0J8G666_9PSED|nr:pentapeptide repeat-containing protein [Pseudomonas fildesensis]KMT56233.1 hypothetical protein ACR52_07585 [Pseudomonas fildesensis]